MLQSLPCSYARSRRAALPTAVHERCAADLVPSSRVAAPHYPDVVAPDDDREAGDASAGTSDIKNTRRRRCGVCIGDGCGTPGITDGSGDGVLLAGHGPGCAAGHGVAGGSPTIPTAGRGELPQKSSKVVVRGSLNFVRGFSSCGKPYW
jgi:hypothetical protein